MTIFDYFEPVFLDFFRNYTLHIGGVFFFVLSVHQNPSFEQLKSTFRQYSRFLTLTKLPGVEKMVEKLSKKKILKIGPIWNRNRGVRNFNITSGTFGDTLLKTILQNITTSFFFFCNSLLGKIGVCLMTTVHITEY